MFQPLESFIIHLDHTLQIIQMLIYIEAKEFLAALNVVVIIFRQEDFHIRPLVNFRDTSVVNAWDGLNQVNLSKE